MSLQTAPNFKRQTHPRRLRAWKQRYAHAQYQLHVIEAHHSRTALSGGDGLVAARHLHHYGYEPTVYSPKQSKNELYARLRKQLEDLSVPFTSDFDAALGASDLVVDAIFGFSFSGEVREPFPKVIEALRDTKVPILAVDAPSSWDIESGPPSDGPGKGFMPGALISLTAPKPLVKHFRGRHFLGGRYAAPLAPVWLIRNADGGLGF